MVAQNISTRPDPRQPEREQALGRPRLSAVASSRPGMRLDGAPQIHNNTPSSLRLHSLLGFMVKLCHLIVQRTQ